MLTDLRRLHAVGGSVHNGMALARKSMTRRCRRHHDRDRHRVLTPKSASTALSVSGRGAVAVGGIIFSAVGAAAEVEQNTGLPRKACSRPDPCQPIHLPHLLSSARGGTTAYSQYAQEQVLAKFGRSF